MIPKTPPKGWYWSHDIKANQIGYVATPGTRLMRLSAYGNGGFRRFAALIYRQAGPAQHYGADLDATGLANLIAGGMRPQAITVREGEGDPIFSIVLDPLPGPLTSVHFDLDEPTLRAMLDGRRVIADIAAYTVAGGRRYAVIYEERPGLAWFITGATIQYLETKLAELGAAPTRLRRHVADGKPMLVAAAEPELVSGWAWAADLDGDGVASCLEENRAYPVDLDASRDERGVRFCVVMHPDTRDQ